MQQLSHYQHNDMYKIIEADPNKTHVNMSLTWHQLSRLVERVNGSYLDEAFQC